MAALAEELRALRKDLARLKGWNSRAPAPGPAPRSSQAPDSRGRARALQTLTYSSSGQGGASPRTTVPDFARVGAPEPDDLHADANHVFTRRAETPWRGRPIHYNEAIAVAVLGLLVNLGKLASIAR